jgi:hypothetical protein
MRPAGSDGDARPGLRDLSTGLRLNAGWRRDRFKPKLGLRRWSEEFRSAEMIRVFPAVAAASFLMATGASADDVSGPINGFGLAGRWAHVDCNAPASQENDFDNWALQSDGAVAETDDGGSAYQSHYRFDRAELIGDSKISLTGVYLGNGHAVQIVIERRGNQQRTYFSRDIAVGRDLIVDGVIQGATPSDWYTKCP